MVFGRRPTPVLDASRMVGIGDDGEMVALVAGECAFGQADHGDRIPFEPFRLVDRHQFHIRRTISLQSGCLVLDGAQGIHPSHEPPERGSDIGGYLGGVVVDQTDDRLDRHMSRRGIDRMPSPADGLGDHGVDVQIERLRRGTHHFEQRAPHHAADRAQHAAG